MPIKVQAATETKTAKQFQRDPKIAELALLQPDQIDAWVDANLRTLNDMKEFAKLILKLNAVKELLK